MQGLYFSGAFAQATPSLQDYRADFSSFHETYCTAFRLFLHKSRKISQFAH
jgi:hypothetical protein